MSQQTQNQSSPSADTNDPQTQPLNSQLQDDQQNASAGKEKPASDRDGSAQAPPKPRMFSNVSGLFSRLFGLGEQDEHDLIDLAERRRRKRGEHSPVSTPSAELEQLAIRAEMTVGELVNVLSRATGDDQAVIDSFEDDTEHWSGSIIRNFFIVFFWHFCFCFAFHIRQFLFSFLCEFLNRFGIS